MSTTTERMRAWLADADARREREKDLPRAYCRVCGGWAKAGEGTREPMPERGLMPDPMGPGAGVILVQPAPAPAGADDWRRECSTCATATMAETVSRVVGGNVTEAEASDVVAAMKSFDDRQMRMKLTFPTAEVAGKATGKPWGHTTREDRDRVRQVLRTLRDEKRPGTSKWGACGMCGRRHSLRWFEPPIPITWPDGSRAPICGECQQVIDRRALPYDVNDLRTLAVEAATGYSSMLYKAPDEFRCYFESKDCDGNGHPEPWDYNDGIRHFRDQVWTGRPNLAPEDRRPEFEKRLADRMAERELAERRKVEAEKATAW